MLVVVLAHGMHQSIAPLVRIGPPHNSKRPVPSSSLAACVPHHLPESLYGFRSLQHCEHYDIACHYVWYLNPMQTPEKTSQNSSLTPTKSHLTPVPALSTQLLWLVILAIPIASIAWTVTHEDVFKESREYCKDRSASAPVLWQRKFFYLFTCEYCFSHYVTAIFLGITRFKLLYPDWRGYLVSLFAIVWMANLYMSVFAHLRLDIHQERIDLKSRDLDLQSKQQERRSDRAA